MSSPDGWRVDAVAGRNPVGPHQPGATRATPLTERILSRLPGPRPVWILIWALVPWLNLAVVVAAGAAEWTGPRVPLAEVFNRVAVTVAIVLSLWGAARIAGEIRALGSVLAEVFGQNEQEIARLFRGVDRGAVPLLLTAVTVIILPIDESLAGDPLAASIQAITWLLVGIPLWTIVWVYLTLQLGLNRLGRGRLALRAYRGDRSLGLRPVGRLAFTGFWMLVGTVAPLVLAGFTDLPGVIVGIGVLVAGVGLFFLSLRRLNRQMAAVKQRELDRARTLYMQAYRQVRDEPTLDVLERQVGLLNAAEALEKRAERIQEWPFDEATFARVVTIASSVAGVIIARLLLQPVGL